MKVALFFGSFNPIHIGHLIIAQHIVENANVDQLWFVVSPQNPFKEKHTLLEDHHRLALVRIGIENSPKMRVSDIEFSMPKPSYTIDTLTYLKEKHPAYEFSLIMGEDNLRSLHKWKNYERILDNHEILIYPRVATTEATDIPEEFKKSDKIQILKDVPMLHLSASRIRKLIKVGKTPRFLVSDDVLKYMQEMHFFE
jgi:nicotinate-nucleotide adenylyltransferase